MNENIKIFEVGGSIRNELLGKPAKDRDFAVIAPDYNTMRQYLLDIGATFYQERPQFVSIRAKLPSIGSVDFTLARKESFYTDARHPDSVTPAKTIEDDLARRDFTMNAIARELGSKVLIDPFKGQKDIFHKIIRTVGNPIERFTEDRLRIFRAIRFSCQLGFSISEETQHAMNYFQSIDDFNSVSTEMLQVELFKAFSVDWVKGINFILQNNTLLSLIKNRNIWLKPTLEAK